MDYAKKALRDTISVLMILVLAAFFGYLVRLVLARGISQEDYGLFYAVFSFFGLFAIFKSIGLNQALAKFIPDYLHKRDYSKVKSAIVSVFLMQSIITTAIALIAIIFSDYIASYFFHTGSASLVIKFLALMFWLIPLENVFRFSFQGFQRMIYFAGVEFLRMVVIFILIIVFLGMGMGIKAPSLAYVLVYLIVPLICIPFFIKTFPGFFRAKLDITKKLVKKLFRFGIPVMAGIFGALIMLYTDTVVLTYFRSMNEVALYQVASPTARLLLYLGYALAAVFLPLSAELWAKGEKDKLRIGMEMLYKYTFLAVIPLALLMLLFPELILKILFGADYVNGGIALQILAVGTIFYSVGHINGNVLTGIGKPKENTKIVLLAALFNLIANIALIPFYGIIGAAVATLVSWLIILGFTSYKIKRYVRAHAPWWGWAKNILAGIIFVALVSFFKRWLVMNVWAEVIISVSAASLAYLGMLLLFRLVTKEDLDFFLYALKRK